MTTIATKLRASLNANVAQRDAYETEKNGAQQITTKIMRYFKLNRDLESTKSDAYFEALEASDVLDSFDFMNNAVKSTARFNVYALEKVAAKLDSLANNKLSKIDATAQKYCIACVLTCLQHRDKETFSFTRKHALAMLSKALRFDTVKVRDLAKTFSVTESTASTQVSSSFRALEALNILTFDESEKDRSVVSEVNYDHAFVKLVEREMLER